MKNTKTKIEKSNTVTIREWETHEKDEETGEVVERTKHRTFKINGTTGYESFILKERKL